MRVLHLYANHKWTGPADLALDLVGSQDGARGPFDEPIEAALALAGFVHAGMDHAMAERARELGLRTRDGLELRRHFHLPSLLADARTLARWQDEGSVDLVHCHQAGDHLTAALAQSTAQRRVPLVRSVWDAKVPPPLPRTSFAFARTQAVIVSFRSLAAEMAATFQLPRDRVIAVPPPLAAPGDGVQRSDGARRALRAELGLGADAVIVGITARIQRKRRWNLVWQLTHELALERPELHIAVLGRPDEGVFEELCERPIRHLGIEDRVHFLGYRRGPGYWAALAGLDVFLFLVPGSDSTCRALREAMALGLPVLSSDLGRLDEIVKDREDGLVRPLDCKSLAEALRLLLDDPELRDRIGRRALAKAAGLWTAPSQLGPTLELYRVLADSVRR